jgi:hypothetical protein
MHKPGQFYSCLLFLLFAIFCGSSQVAFSQFSAPSDSLSKVLIDNEAKMFNAILTADRPSTDKMIGEDYVSINADGVMQNKTEMMKAFGKFKGATVSLHDKQIRTYGNLSLITGRAKFYLKSILVAEVFYTETWINRSNRLYFIGWQGTMTGTPSYYPVIFSLLALIIIYFIARVVIKRFRRAGTNRV